MSDHPTRGDIWMVRFDPSEGDEIRKIRPARARDNRSASLWLRRHPRTSPMIV